MTTATVSLPPPRRKTRVREVPGAALPLPSALPHPPCTHYEATYSQGHITICDPRQAAALWHNGYFGHGMEAGGSGKPRGRKKWRLVEAAGLKDGKWFKEAHEAVRWRGGKGRVEEQEKVEMNEEREGHMDEEMGEVKEEEKTVNVKGDEMQQEKEKDNEEMEEESKNMEGETLNIENDERSAKEEKEKEAERSIKKKEEGERENTNRTRTPEDNLEEPRENEDDFMNDHKEEAEMRSDSEDSEPWRTVLVLSGDQETTADTPNSHTYLTLLPEEALFLSYALGCLVVTYTESPANRKPGKRALQEQDTHEMTIDEMWRVFSQDDPAFPVKYAVFHHFRTQGWVVKGGLKYGVDYVLYPVGPPFYHSQYAVKIHSVWADTLTLDHSLLGHAVTWTTIATTERLSNHINKTPVICFVLRPRSLTQSSLGHIECLKELKVQEMVLGRWNPSNGSG